MRSTKEEMLRIALGEQPRVNSVEGNSQVRSLFPLEVLSGIVCYSVVK